MENYNKLYAHLIGAEDFEEKYESQYMKSAV